jgi:acyl-ACP thioesterase
MVRDQQRRSTLDCSFRDDIAVIFAPIIQRSIALRQQRGSVVSANRVRWIEDFRKDVAAFCELAHHVAYHRARMKLAEQGRNKTMHEESRKEINEKTIPLNTTYYHLMLRLNPKKKGTDNIRRILVKIDESCNNIAVYDDDFYHHMNHTIEELILVVRDYLSVEWTKVERLK